MTSKAEISRINGTLWDNMPLSLAAISLVAKYVFFMPYIPVPYFAVELHRCFMNTDWIGLKDSFHLRIFCMLLHLFAWHHQGRRRIAALRRVTFHSEPLRSLRYRYKIVIHILAERNLLFTASFFVSLSRLKEDFNVQKVAFCAESLQFFWDLY